MIGTAFYRFGEVNHDDCIDLCVLIGYDPVDNQIDTLTKAFQATTVACGRLLPRSARKLDAISTGDYHDLLRRPACSSRPVSHTIDAPEVNAATMQKMRAKKAAIRSELAQAWLRLVRGRKTRQAAGGSTANEKAPDGNPLTWLAATIACSNNRKTSFRLPTPGESCR